jgi:hypothetical protein
MNAIKSILIGISVFIVSTIAIILILLGNISMYILSPLILAVLGAIAYYDMKKDGTL